MKTNRLRKAVQAIALAAGSAAAGAAADPAPGPGAPPGAGPGVRRGSVPGFVLVIERHEKEVKECYEPERAKNPQLAGRVVVRFTIGETGMVTDSEVKSSTLGNAAVENCVVRAFLGWEFPKPPDGNPIPLIHKFVFPREK